MVVSTFETIMFHQTYLVAAEIILAVSYFIETENTVSEVPAIFFFFFLMWPIIILIFVLNL